MLWYFAFLRKPFMTNTAVQKHWRIYLQSRSDMWKGPRKLLQSSPWAVHFHSIALRFGKKLFLAEALLWTWCYNLTQAYATENDDDKHNYQGIHSLDNFLSNPWYSALEITMKICTNLSRGNRFCYNSAQCSVAPKLWRTLENKDVIHLLKWLWFIFQRLPAGDS